MRAWWWLPMLAWGLGGCDEGRTVASPDAVLPAADAADDAPGTTPDASVDVAVPRAPLDAARDRLLATYLARLRSRPDVAQSNGLRGRDLGDVCDLWGRLQPSARAVFLTDTARLGASVLGSDRSTMLDHVTALYRVAGGEGATADAPGSCGGAEFNRVIVSMDATLHDALVATSDRRGARRSDGAYDLGDVIASSFWRDSHDLGGPHGPFTLSDETEGGAPRGQVHFFRDPRTAPATSPLGRLDVADVIDPLALEMDQDYDCVHASNPLCSYTFYGPACLPAATRTGVQLYAERYGAVDLAWVPGGCAARGP